jgi:ferredoxin-NADP reductase/MOSC domain-containing protein YiiM/ferredoxin
MARLISVNVGLPRDVAWRGATVHTAIWKDSVSGRRMVRRLNIDGDGQGDKSGHGGEHRAVMVYQLDSYHHWERHFQRDDFVLGQFGENFTIEGLPDDEVCIGDRYRIGDATFEVSQPRVTCYRVGIRMDEPQMPALLVSHRRPGFYFRVIEEGAVGAGDEILKVTEGEERVSVAEVDGLLYLPDHPRDGLERALRARALSPGWQGSLKALLDQNDSGAHGKGNVGLTGAVVPAPAWTGFRSLRVAHVEPETASVVSLTFEAADGSPLPAAIPGQFLVLKLRPNPELPVVLRNYSLSGAPGTGAYRISVKREANGIASNFLDSKVRAGDSLDVAAPRGSFTLQQGRQPVILLSAGIGATPVMAMLHALASQRSERAIWWLQGARNRSEHPFAEESRELVAALANGRRYIAYSKPEPGDRPSRDFDTVGRLNVNTLEQLGIPREADFYLCGPAGFLASFIVALKKWGVEPGRVHSEVFGPGESITPGIAAPKTPLGPPQSLPGPGPQVSFVRSGVTASWSARFQSLLELAEACKVPVAWACRTGVCHTCECGLVDGAVDYQPDPLEPPAEGNLLICCSQPHGNVEIDL